MLGKQPLGPTSKGGLSRQRILRAARRCFATHGYERTTIREVAAEADIDKSSVMKYFGSKENLFREAVTWSIPIDSLTTEAQNSSSENYLEAMLALWESEPDTPMAVLLRTSMTSELASTLLCERMTRDSIDVIERHIDSDDARLRAAVFASVMMGIASARHLIKLPDMAEADVKDIVRVAAPLISNLLSPQS